MPVSKDVKEAGLNALKKNCTPEMFHDFCEAYGIDSAAEEKIWFDVQLLGRENKDGPTDSEGEDSVDLETQKDSADIEKYLTSLIKDAAERELREIDFPIAEFIGNIMHIIDEVIREISDKFNVPSAVLFVFMWTHMAPILVPMIKVAAGKAANCLPASAKYAFSKISVAAREYLNSFAVKTMGERIGQMSSLDKLLCQMVAFKMTGMPLKVLVDQVTELPDSKITTGDGGSALLCGICLMYGVGAFMGSDFVSSFVNALPSGSSLVPGVFALQFVSGEAHNLAEGFSVTVIPSQLFVGYKTCVGIKEGLESRIEGSDSESAKKLARDLELSVLLRKPETEWTEGDHERINELLENGETFEKARERLNHLPDPGSNDFRAQQNAFTNYYLLKLTQNPDVNDKVRREVQSILTKKGYDLTKDGVANKITEEFGELFEDSEKKNLVELVNDNIRKQFMSSQQSIIEEGIRKRKEAGITLEGDKEKRYDISVDNQDKKLEKLEAGYMPGKTLLGKPEGPFQRLTYPIVNNLAYPISRTVLDRIILPVADITGIALASSLSPIAFVAISIYNQFVSENKRTSLSAFFKNTSGFFYYPTKFFDKGRLNRTSDEWKLLRSKWIGKQETLSEKIADVEKGIADLEKKIEDLEKELNKQSGTLSEEEQEQKQKEKKILEISKKHLEIEKKYLEKELKDVNKKIIYTEGFIDKIKKEQDKLEDNSNNISKLAQSISKLPQSIVKYTKDPRALLRSTGAQKNGILAHGEGYFRAILNVPRSFYGVSEQKKNIDRIKREIGKELGNSPEERLITFMNKYQNMTLNEQNELRKGFDLTPAQIYSQVRDYMRDNSLNENVILKRDAHKFLLQERKESIDLMFLSPVLFFVRPLVLIPAFIVSRIGESNNIARYYENVLKEGYKADFQGLMRIGGKCAIPLVTVLDFVYDTFLSRTFRTLGRVFTGGRKKLNLEELKAGFFDKEKELDLLDLNTEKEIRGLSTEDENKKLELEKEQDLMERFEISDQAYEAQDNAVKKGLVQQILGNTKFLETPLNAKENKNTAQKNLIGLYTGVVRTCSIFENLIDTKVDKDNIDDILDKLDFAITTIEGALDKVHMDDSKAVLQEFKVIRNEIFKNKGEPLKVQELLSSTRLKGSCLNDVFQSFLSKFTFETSLFNQKTKSRGKALMGLFVNTDDFSKKLVDCASNINRYKAKVLNTYSKVIDTTTLPEAAKKHIEKSKDESEDGRLKVENRRRLPFYFRKRFMSMDFLNYMGDPSRISSRVSGAKQREPNERIANIHETLEAHHDSLSKTTVNHEVEKTKAESAKAIVNLAKLDSTFDELEQTSSGESVHQERVKAILQTVKNIHQKIGAKGADGTNMAEVHESIDRAGKIAEIHKFLEEHKSTKGGEEIDEGASSAIKNLTELHQGLNNLEKSAPDETGKEKLKAMHQKINDLHTKVTEVQKGMAAPTDDQVKEIHEEIKTSTRSHLSTAQ